jgi:hypothetical protein
MGDINAKVQSAGKDVILDFSDCTANGNRIIGDRNVPSSDRMNIIQSNSHIIGIILPSGLNEIGAYAFYNCTSLTLVTIPTGAGAIQTLAFFNCSSLPGITIPAYVDLITFRVFDNCPSLISVTFETGSTISQNDFSGAVFPEGPSGVAGNVLREAYLEPAPTGGEGIYRRSPGGSDWTKQ